MFPLLPPLLPRRSDGWCSGRFYHLKEVCWSDPTNMFLRYIKLAPGSDSTVQEPKVLAPFYMQLEGMSDLFARVCFSGVNIVTEFCMSLCSFSCFSCFTVADKQRCLPCIEENS